MEKFQEPEMKVFEVESELVLCASGSGAGGGGGASAALPGSNVGSRTDGFD